MKAELLRKTLHIICMILILLVVNMFATWYDAVFAVIIFVLIGYPILVLLERFPKYSNFFAERRKGEVKRSLLLVSLMVVILISVFWGWLGTTWKYTIIIAVMAWGFGDAAAALVGKAYGDHYIDHNLVEGKKTIEGTLAMFAVSWLVIFVIIMIYTEVPWYLCFIIALLVAPVCAIVELFSRRGMDTITVPISAAILIFTYTYISTFLVL